MKPKSAFRNLAACAALGFTLNPTAGAAVVTKASTGTDLTNVASWGGTAPAAADTATWSGTSLGAGLTLGSGVSWQGIAVSGAASNIGITGAGPLSLGNGGIDLALSTVDLAISPPVTLGASQTWRAAGGRTLTVSGPVGGTGDLAFGAAAPTTTYSGYLSASGGTPTTVFTNTSLANVTSVNGMMQGGWIPAATPATGYFLINNGATATVQLQFYDGTYTKVAKIQFNQSGANVTAYQIYAKYKAGNYVGQNFDDPYPVTGQPPAGSGGYGVSTTTAGVGQPSNGTIALSGANTYAGATTVNVGTLSVGGGNAIPDASAVTLGMGSTLLLNAGETIGSLAGAGNCDLQANPLTAGGNNASTTCSGVLSGTGGTLVKSGTGTLTLTAGNTFTGGTTLSKGTVVITSDSGLGSSGTVVMNDANTGADNTSLFAQVGVTGDLFVPNPITVANQGGGTTTIGTNRTGAGRTFFNGEITLNKDLTLSSMLTDRTMYRGGIRGTGNLTITGGNRTTLSDVITENDGEGPALYDFTGNVAITATGTVVQINSNMEFTNAGTVTVDTGATLRTAYGKTLGLNALAGSGTVTSVAGSGTIIAGIANGSSTFSGVISGTGGDALKLTKTGSGTLTLAGTNTYSGVTTINGGTLKLGTGGSIDGTPSISVAPGATFDAADTGFTLGAGKTLTAGDTNPGADVTGAIVSQGTIRPGGNGALGTIKGITNLTLGGTLDWERSANSTASDGIAINGTLAISAGLAVNVSTMGFPSAGVRSYTVVSGLTSPLAQADIDNLPALPADYSWDTSDPTALKITRVQAGSNLVWTGLGANGNWDFAAVNWTGSPGIFQDGDFCTFDDTATGTTTIDVPVDVTPGAILFNNSVLNYTVGSSTDPKAGFGGAATLTKQGGGTLTLTGSNYHTGGTTITGGVVSFASGAIPLTGALTMNGGTLRWESGNTEDVSGAVAMVDGKTATFDTNGNDVTFATGIGGSSTAALVKSGAGKLALGGTGTWTGGLEVRQGTVVADANGALGGGTVTLGTTTRDTALILANRADITNGVTVSAAGTGAVVIGADNTGSGTNAATIAGTITLNRATTFSGGVTDDRLAIDGRITGNVGTLGISGGSRVTLASQLNDFTGNIVVTGAGTVLQASVATAAGVIPDATGITIDAGAIFQTASNSGVETVGGINGNGTFRSFKDANPGNFFGLAVVIGGGDQNGDFGGVVADGNAALSVTKSGTGTQILRGFNTYTGNTTVNAGTLHLRDDAALTFRITNAAANTLTGAGTVILDGDFAIDVSAVTATTGTWQLENAATLTGAYGSTFQVVTPAGVPWTDAGSNKWKLAAGTLEFTFDETNGTLTAQLAGFASWISKAEFGLAQADQDPTDDPDGDGVNNLVEYAIAGRNPAVSDGAPGSIVAGTLSFTKRAEAAADAKISYAIQESDDLGAADPWTEAPAGPDYSNNATAISYILPPGKVRTFARLVVTQAP